VIPREILVEGCSIVEKLLSAVAMHSVAVRHGLHDTLAAMLAAGEPMILQTSLVALRKLARSVQQHPEVCSLPCARMLLEVVNEDYPCDMQKLAVEVLLRFTHDERCRRQIRLLDGVRCCVTLLTSTTSRELIVKLADLLTCISYDPDGRVEIQRCGGIQVLLIRLAEQSRLPHYHQLNRPRPLSATAPDSPSRGQPPSAVGGAGPAVGVTSAGRSESGAESVETVAVDPHVWMMQSRICTTLTWLSMTDMNSSLIREDNGVYVIASLLLPPSTARPAPPAKVELQRHAFRALRFLFGLERNRRLLKRLFAAEIFEQFLRVEHYQIDLRQCVGMRTASCEYSEGGCEHCMRQCLLCTLLRARVAPAPHHNRAHAATRFCRKSSFCSDHP
jgi:hypothetical protein